MLTYDVHVCICLWCGQLKEVELVVDKKVGLSRGTAYVEFESRKDAEGEGRGWQHDRGGCIAADLAPRRG